MAKLNIDYYKAGQQGIDLQDVDRVIRGYIMAVGDENCDKAIEYDPREEVFQDLSSLRASTVSWYPFEEGASVLQVEGGFGAITGALCDKAGSVTVTEPFFFRAKAIAKRYEKRNNLYVYAGDVFDMDFKTQFDYILLSGVIEKAGRGSTENPGYIQYLRSLVKYLKPEGKVLITADNLYGLSRRDNERQTPMRYQAGDKAVRYFHRKQLIDIVEGAGLTYYKFYYPLPDYRVVGAVYSDDCLPGPGEWGQICNYNAEKQFPFQAGSTVLEDLAENGMFRFLADSFFLEAGRTRNQSKLKSAMVLCSYEEDIWPPEEKENVQEGKKSRNELIIEQLKLKPAVVEIDQDRKELMQVMEVQLNLLRKLKEVCDKHGLRLLMIYGTLLGAVRHGGMIPGDDDIDVALIRQDYDKLLSLSGEFSGEYFLQTPWNDNCFYGGYLKLRNKNTTAIHPQNWWTGCCEGIGIDIFPLDEGYKNHYLERWKEVRICFWQRLLYAKAYGHFARFMDMPLLVWKAYKYFGKLFTREQLAERLNSVMAEGSSGNDSPFGVFAHYSRGKGYRRLERKAFTETVQLAYEDLMLDAPRGRYEVLSMLYGDSFMTPSAWSEGKRRHGFYKADRPYTECKRRFTGLMNPPPEGKEIVLFGDGQLFDGYFERYQDKYIPSHIVLIEEECVPKEVHGIRTEYFRDFKPENIEMIYPVICSIYFRETERILQQAGYKDYYIYLKQREWMLLANPSYALQELRRN